MDTSLDTKCFLLSFNASHQETWGTYFGGDNQSGVGGIAAYKDNLYIAGGTYSDQSSSDAYQRYPLCFSGIDYIDSVLGGSQDAFVARFDITSLVTSLAEPLNDSIGARLFPNPNSGNFTIMVNPNLTGVKQIKIVNTVGQLILSDETLDNRIQFESNALAPGIYDALIMAGGSKTNIKFVIVK